MRIHVTELQVGDIISRDVFNGYGLHVLSAGTPLGEMDISKLFQHQLDYIDIEPRAYEGETADPNEKPRSAVLRMMPDYEGAVIGSKALFEEALTNGRIHPDSVDQAYDPLVEQFQEEHDLVSLLLLLQSKEEYTFQHSVQVGMLSYFIAQWMERSEEEALMIGKAGYLHDIGKCRIDPAILNKPGKLTDEEYEIIQKYPVYGFEIVHESFHDEMLAKAVLQHRERIDGSGYPYGIKGSNIHFAARIIAVADTYSAMISTRSYRAKRDLLFVLKELHLLSFNELDPAVVHTFIRHMIPNFIGKTAVLSTGETGTIVMTNPSDFFRPLVRINDVFLDISRHPEIEVVDVLM